MQKSGARDYLLAALIGLLAGLLAAGLHIVLDWLEAQRLLWSAASATSLPLSLLIVGGSGVMVCISLWLVRRWAPEAHGSGVPQVETQLANGIPIRWRAILPVKFFASVLAIGPGMVLGREGPTIHLGAACGQMVADAAGKDSQQNRHLILAGVAAGLGAAFNAPLAAILLITEEMRDQFSYTHRSMVCVAIASLVAVVVCEAWLGQGFELNVGAVAGAALGELPWFGLLGVLAGMVAAVFNSGLVYTVRKAGQFSTSQSYLFALGIGGLVGALVLAVPAATGGGEGLVVQLLEPDGVLTFWLGLLSLRLVLSILCYGTGVPGGIFAPLLGIGALLGAGYSLLLDQWLPGLASTPALFMITAMGAVFAGSVRAPLTGILLILEVTGAYDATLALVTACLAATITAQALRGQPIYRQLGFLG
jgi:H+/Cl- antiporter ClcA